MAKTIMHHSNKNLDETYDIDTLQDDAVHIHPYEQAELISVGTLDFMDVYVDKHCQRQLQGDSIFADDNQGDSSHASDYHQHTKSMSVRDHQQKKTLFNIRFTSLGKRLSDRAEQKTEDFNCVTNGISNPQITGGKKSRTSGHVTFQNYPESVFEFVSHKATKFSKGSSSSDVNLRALSSFDSEEDLEAGESLEEADSDSDNESLVIFHLGNHKVTNTLCKNNAEKQKPFHMVINEATERSSEVIQSSLPNVSSKDRTGYVLQNNTELTDNIHNLPELLESADESVLKKEFNEPAVQRLELSPPKRAKRSKLSREEIPVGNVSNIDHNIASNIVTSGVSKETYPLPDVKSPPAKSVIISVEDEKKEAVESDTERSLVNSSPQPHANQLQGTAFTEFVNIDDFQTALRSRVQHVEDGVVVKSEKQFEALLKAGSGKSLKACLRNSQWPAESGQRRHLWEQLCCHLLHAQENLYHKLVSDMISEEEGGLRLPSFVEPENINSYFLTIPGLTHAKTVLCLLNHLHPDITYCPILYPMSCLFLHYMSPQACFNCLQALLRTNRSCYFTQTYVKTQACKYVLRDLAKKHAKQAYDLMAQDGRRVEDILDNWMLWLFRDLPFQHLVSILSEVEVRIIDSFLLEGHKIFYRISLAIVILFAKGYNKSGNEKISVADFSADVSSFCRKISIVPRKLLQVAFGIRGLSRKEISKLHERNEAFVMSLPGRKSVSTVRLKELTPSTILSPDILQHIWQWIPMRLSLMKLKLLFSSNEDGTAIRTLYTRTEHAAQTILVIKTTNNEVFGAFCSTSWHTRHEKNKPKTSFFGTGETFVFSAAPDLRRYQWTGLLANPPDQTADLFMAGDDHMLMIGSGNGTAIYLDATMNMCSSTHCDTFNNHPLCSTIDFSCHVVEVFGFTE